MRCLLWLLFFVSGQQALAQRKEANLLKHVERFHALMVEPRFFIDQYLHDSLRYGHSNGWIEDKTAFLQDLTTQKLVYHSITMDSVELIRQKKTAAVRFVGNFDVSLEGNRNTFRLHVLEIWVKQGRRWKILARQAIR